VGKGGSGGPRAFGADEDRLRRVVAADAGQSARHGAAHRQARRRHAAFSRERARGVHVSRARVATRRTRTCGGERAVACGRVRARAERNGQRTHITILITTPACVYTYARAWTDLVEQAECLEVGDEDLAGVHGPDGVRIAGAHCDGVKRRGVSDMAERGERKAQSERRMSNKSIFFVTFELD
jgi:hypothetical protein